MIQTVTHIVANGSPLINLIFLNTLIGTYHVIHARIQK